LKEMRLQMVEGDWTRQNPAIESADEVRVRGLLAPKPTELFY
jgi:hypothetical protein